MARRFGPGPYLLGLRRNPGLWGEGFPFDVPAVAGLDGVALGAPVTLLAGDNGTGKSTIVEAAAAGDRLRGRGRGARAAGERPAVPHAVLDGALEPELSPRKPRNGYFLRAESFFNVAAFVDRGEIFSPDVSLYGGVPLHEQSHGQSFLALAANRFGGDGLYILDEPEAALSVSGALALRRRHGPRGARRAPSSSSRRIRRCCWPARARASTSSTSAGSRRATTTISTPSGSRARSSRRPSASCARRSRSSTDAVPFSSWR